MVKKYVITFSISVLILFSISIILLMIMIPQQDPTMTGTIQNYQKVNPTDYTFTQTKDITQQNLVKEYTITSADLGTFKKYNQYVSGNSDPFTPPSDLAAAAGNNNQNTTNTNTTNSNGGTANPPATGK